MFRAPPVLALVLALATLAPSAAGEPAAPPSLNGEKFQQAIPTITSSSCASPTPTFTYRAEGQATGPYPGSFVEEGRVEHQGPGDWAVLKATFTVDSPVGQVSGTKIGTVGATCAPCPTGQSCEIRFGPLPGTDGNDWRAKIRSPDDRMWGDSGAVVTALSRSGGSSGFSSTFSSREPPQLLCTLLVTRSTTLDRDIDDCGPGDPAVEIVAPNVTLDLNGHTVRGGNYGIRNRGFDRVTIKNGSIYGDNADAVSIEGADHNTLRGLYVENFSRAAIVLDGSDDNTIVANRALGYGRGVALRQGSDRNFIAGNNTEGNYSGLGIAGDGNVIVWNFASTGELDAITVGAGTGNVVAFNLASSGYENGIVVAPAAGRAVLVGNRAVRNGSSSNNPPANIDGIHVDGASALLLANVAKDNEDYGIQAVPGTIGVGNRASGNGNPAQCLNVVCR